MLPLLWMTALRTRSALAVVEAAYTLDGADDAWLAKVLRVASPDLGRGLGLYGATGRIIDGSLVPSPPLVAHELTEECLAHARALHPQLPCPILDAFVPRAVVVGGLDEAWPKRLDAARLYREGMQGAGVRDALVLYARGSATTAVKIVAPSRSRVVTTPRARATWGRVVVHLATALRLRRRVSRGAEPSAVLDARGRLVDARGRLADDARRRERVVAELRATMEARAEASHDPARALEVLGALVAGRYSAVDRWDAGGRRYVVLYRNPPFAGPGDPRGLGRTERRVADLVARGASLKEASYALGVGKTATQRALSAALQKLGLSRPSELSPLFVGAKTAARVQAGRADLEVLVATTEVRSDAAPGLTTAERDVARAAIEGASDAAIARTRGTSARTVANQLRRIFEKLGVKSRGELRAKLLGAP